MDTRPNALWSSSSDCSRNADQLGQNNSVKQILQHIDSGTTEVLEVPCPSVNNGCLLIRSHRTLVSPGTERMLVEFGKANLLKKAQQQPEKVRMVVDKIRTDGVVSTLETIRQKLKQSIPLGYCNVGTVLEVGPGVKGFKAGDRVVSNGSHAEVVNVPVNLCAHVPDSVTDDQAVFTVLGAIGLQGIRLAQPTLGEAIVVSGLGVIGLLTVQLLRAHGCRILATDFDSQRLELAQNFGAEIVDLSTGADPIALAKTFSRGRGVDAVIVTASTSSSEPVHQAAAMCRKRGRIVLVGVTGLELSRADFYEKELTFQVSCSYGPGRYDSDYEEKGIDYPVGFVRWTEQRNFEAVLDMLAENRIEVESLVSHRFDLEQADQAYNLLGGIGSSLGIILEYPFSEAAVEKSVRNRPVPLGEETAKTKGLSVSFVGAGNYATTTLIPAFIAAGVHLKSIASRTGTGSAQAAKKFGFELATTDTKTLISDETVDAVVISTRHNTHAHFVLKALEAGKHVFVEKPLCLTEKEINAIESAWEARAAGGRPALLMVGFNRRFAPQVQKISSLLSSVRGPKSFVMTVNAGSVPSGHWTQDLSSGGGRIIGEACHFIDLLRYLSGASIVDSQIMRMSCESDDTATLQLEFAEGSIGTVHYLANGSKRFPKERLEVFCAGRILQLDNFRRLKGFGWPGFRRMNLWRQNKGQKACAAAFIKSLRNGEPAPISIDEILEVSRISIALAQQHSEKKSMSTL